MRTEATLKDAPDATELQDVKGRIDIDHVGFAYEGDHDVLQDVSLHIAPGETIAFVGSSGGGKTTLSQLIPRFYDVTSGSISIDGTDVRKATQESLHKNIGVVQQEVFLFADSIAENIRYGKLDATMDEIVRAAKIRGFQKKSARNGRKKLWNWLVFRKNYIYSLRLSFPEDRSREFLLHVSS